MKYQQLLKCFVFSFFILFLSNAFSAKLDELNTKIQELEEELQSMQEDSSEQASKFDRSLRFSGYMDVEYRMEGNKNQKTDKGFRLHHTNLYLNKRILKKWRFFAEIEFEDGAELELVDDNGTLVPDGAGGKIFLEASNIDFQYNSLISLRFGRMFTPAGIWSIDHDPPFVPTQERPLHIRKIFPQVIDGIMMYGVKPIGSTFFKYHTYVGNGENNSGAGDKNEKRAAGGEIAMILPIFTFTEFGASFLTDPELSGQPNTKKTAQGVHFRLNKNKFHFQAEYAQSEMDDGVTQNEQSGYYAQSYLDVGNWTFGGRYDIFETDIKEKRTSAFINYHIGYNILFKLEHHLTEKLNEENFLTIGSLVLYLGE